MRYSSALMSVPFEEAIERLLRGAVDVVTREELERKLREGRPLRAKLGVDPTYTDLHLGHAVVLRKLRQFQDLGHETILIIGDFTARIGDPTGQSKTRPQLTREEIETNARTYLEQVGKILDRKKLRVEHNADWLERMTLADVVHWTSRMTVARLLERGDFAERYKSGTPIYMHETLYVMMQAVDSVHLKADVELGGHDQIFNLLAGRDLMREDGQEPQVCLTVPLLIGLDGHLKMSKSARNHVGIAEPPFEMFSKILSLPDGTMKDYFLLLTEVPVAEIDSILQGHPRDAKLRLAGEIVTQFHGEAAARDARARWEEVFTRKEVPEEMQEVRLPSPLVQDGKVVLRELLKAVQVVKSGSEANRLIEQGGVELDGTRCTEPFTKVPVHQGSILRVGKKKRYFRLTF